MSDFDIQGNLPKPLKYALIVIDRVGFPIFAFCLMAYMCFIALDKMNGTVQKNTEALVNLTHKINRIYHVKEEED